MFRYFETTNYADEQSFIGRQVLLSKLKRELCTDADVRVSYCGLLKIGKTSLMHRFEDQVNKGHMERNGYRFIVAYYSLYLLGAGESLFERLTEKIDEALSALQIACPYELLQLKQKVSAAEKSRDQAKRMSEYVDALYQQGLRVILVLDEFQSLPESGAVTFADYALLHGMRHISIACVGRLPFDKTMNELAPSTWNNRLTCRQGVIYGFDEEDLQEYRAIFYSQFSYDMTWMQEELEYYCGRSPYLLSCFGEEIMLALQDSNADAIDAQWLDRVANTYHPLMYDDYVQNQLERDSYGGMTNLERLLRIVIGPQIGIREWDISMMKELGYITSTGKADYAISPRFMKRLERMPISGELPTKLVAAEICLRRLIHKKLPEICEAHSFDEPVETGSGKKRYRWSPEERTILNVELMRIPERVADKNRLDKPYRIYDPVRSREHPEADPVRKYAEWIVQKQATMPSANIEEVMLLKERLSLINGCWPFFAESFGGEAREIWRDKFFLMCIARNPALHAGTLTDQEQIDCERTCDDILRRLGSLNMEDAK